MKAFIAAESNARAGSVVVVVGGSVVDVVLVDVGAPGTVVVDDAVVDDVVEPALVLVLSRFMTLVRKWAGGAPAAICPPLKMAHDKVAAAAELAEIATQNRRAFILP